MISSNNLSIGYTDNNQSGSQSSNSSNTFLNIPRRMGQIQQQLQNDNQSDFIVANFQSNSMPNNNVSFQNPNVLQKSEHKESFDEYELGVSRNSENKSQPQMIQYSTPDRISFNPNIELNREEQYEQLKKFQVEMGEIMKSNVKLRLISNRKFSENTHNGVIHGTPERSQHDSKDSFQLSPQFKPKHIGQLIEVPTLKLRENNEIQLPGIDASVNEASVNEASVNEANMSSGKIEKPINDEVDLLNPKQENIEQQKRYVNFDKITLLVTRFISKLLLIRWIEKKKIHYFRKQYLKQIGDIASSLEFYKEAHKDNLINKTNLRNKFFKKLKKLKLAQALFIPTSNIVQIFQAILILFYCFSIFQTTLIFAYKLEQNIYVSVITIFAIVLDSFILASTSVFQRGVLVKDISQIIIFHQKKIIEDLILCLALLLKIILNINLIALVVIQRVQRVIYHLKYLEKNAQLQNPGVLFFKFFQMILVTLFVSHFIACAFNYISILEGSEQIELLWIDKYLNDLAYSTLMISTIGSEIDVPPTRCLLVFSVTIPFISMFTLGHAFICLNSICRFQETEDQRQITDRTNYYSKRGISKPILAEIRSHIEYKRLLFHENDDKTFSEITSQTLLQKLSINLYGNIVRSSALLQSICSPDCLDKLCKYLHFMKLDKEEIFIKQGQVSNQLIFLIEGEVSQFVELQSSLHRCSINVLRKSPINETSFLLQQTHETSYKSNKEIKIAYLNFSDFFECVRSYPKDLEKLAMVRDNLIFNINRKNRLICPNCSYRGHSFFSCPFVYYVPDRTEILKQYNVNIALERKKHFRNDSKRFNTRLNKNLISITGISFAIAQKYHKESDLTNEVMNRLQGSNQNYDDSLFGEISGNQDDKSSRNNIDRQYTSFTRQTDGVIHLTAQNTVGSNHTQQQQNTIVNIQQFIFKKPLRVDTITVTERDPSLQSVKGNKQNNSISSIKVNVIKSNIQIDPIIDKIHLKNHKLTTTSAGNIIRNERPKLSYMSANPPQNPIQNISVPTKDSDSLKQQLTRTGSNNIFHSSISPGLFNPDDPGTEAILENFSSPITPIKPGSGYQQRLEQFEIDRMHNFNFFFPSYNADNITLRYNLRRKTLSRPLLATRDIQQHNSPISSYRDIFKSQTEKALTQKLEINEHTVS